MCEELKNYVSVIDGLHEQAEQLGEQDQENTDVVGRLASISRRYKDLLELAELREQRLKDALSLYKFYNDADNVDNWVEEKVRCLWGATCLYKPSIDCVWGMLNDYDVVGL